MYTDIKRLTGATDQLAAAAAPIYTTPAGKTAQIATVLLHNTAATAENVILLDSGTADANRILNLSLEPNETYEFSPKVPICLAADGTLQGVTTTASKVNVKVYGREEE
jgi:hypothetical protein